MAPATAAGCSGVSSSFTGGEPNPTVVYPTAAQPIVACHPFEGFGSPELLSPIRVMPAPPVVIENHL